MRSRRSSLPTVRSATLTDQRDAISACRSAQRQRTHLVALKIRAFQHHGPKLLHLRLVQRQRASGAATRTQSGHAFRVVAQHPVTQCLPIHAVQLRRRLAWMALQHQCYCQQTPHHRTGLRPRRQFPQLRRRKLKTGDLDRPAHPVALPANRRDTQRESYSSRFGNLPGEESIILTAGMSAVVATTLTEFSYLRTVGQRAHCRSAGPEVYPQRGIDELSAHLPGFRIPDHLVSVMIKLLRIDRFGCARTWNVRPVDVCSAPTLGPREPDGHFPKADCPVNNLAFDWVSDSKSIHYRADQFGRAQSCRG